jgi:hypothetical protein
LRRHLKAIKAGSVVHFASAVYSLLEIFLRQFFLKLVGAAYQ